ncbi:MAG: arsenate reductase family protein [Deltaproteobacteria bacterium]|nr:arsenate reductase family protein [Deltaproteobacteria bacterium]
MSLKVYCYSGCGTCKKALKYLEAKGIAYKALPIRETPPSIAELKKMLQHQNGELKKLFNTSSKDYRDGGYKDKMTMMSESEAIEILHTNGNLIKRPFVLGSDFGLVGFKADHWDSVL